MGKSKSPFHLGIIQCGRRKFARKSESPFQLGAFRAGSQYEFTRRGKSPLDLCITQGCQFEFARQSESLCDLGIFVFYPQGGDGSRNFVRPRNGRVAPPFRRIMSIFRDRVGRAGLPVQIHGKERGALSFRHFFGRNC